MLKKILVSFIALLVIFTSFSLVFPENTKTVSAATCKNPYKGYLAKYNPCVTHTTTNYIYVKKNTYGTPIALTAAGVTTTAANKALKKLGLKALPVVGGIVWASDAVAVADHYINKYWSKKGIYRFKVTYTWKYQVDPLKDGGGIPKVKVLKTKVVAEYR